MSIETIWLNPQRTLADFRGLSTDDKPTSSRGLVDGVSTFEETDTGEKYLWIGRNWPLIEPQSVVSIRDRVVVVEAQNVASTTKIETLERDKDALVSQVTALEVERDGMKARLDALEGRP